MSLRHLPASARIAKPWKNGGGVTRDVVMFPPEAGMDDFLWRLSIADVAADGPFSTFAGIDRTIAILSGKGIRLDIAGRAPVTLTPTSAAYAFPGDALTSGTLSGGLITDLNLMTRRGASMATMQHFERASACEFPVAGASLILWHAGSGHLAFGERSLKPEPLDAAIASERGTWHITPETPCRFYLIEITLL